MAQIKINDDDQLIFGKVSFARERVIDETATDPDEQFQIIITGVLEMHPYVEEILEIQTERYIIKGVDVFREDFGSNSNNIGYSFYADDIIIKDDPVPDDISWALEEEEIDKERKDGELFHSYLFTDGFKLADSIAEKYRKKEEEENGQR